MFHQPMSDLAEESDGHRRRGNRAKPGNMILQIGVNRNRESRQEPNAPAAARLAAGLSPGDCGGTASPALYLLGGIAERKHDVHGAARRSPLWDISDDYCRHPSSPRTVVALFDRHSAGLFVSLEPIGGPEDLAEAGDAAAHGLFQSAPGVSQRHRAFGAGPQGRGSGVVFRQLRAGRRLRGPRARPGRPDRDDEQLIALQNGGNRIAGRESGALWKHFRGPLGDHVPAPARKRAGAAAPLRFAGNDRRRRNAGDGDARATAGAFWSDYAGERWWADFGY